MVNIAIIYINKETALYDWSSLTKRDISNKYRVSQKFDTFQEISKTHTPNDEYENFVIAHMEAAAECIATKPNAKCKRSIGVVRKICNNIKNLYLMKETLQIPTRTNIKKKPREN